MATWDICYSWMLDNEDAGRKFELVPDAPPGAHAISGINSAAFPAQFAQIAAIAQDQRGPAVEQFYQQEFWNQWFDQLTSDELAKRVFDAAVNMGSGTAWKILQNALAIQADGAPGPITVSAANGDTNTVSAFVDSRKAHYQVIVAAHPEDERYLAGWLARASK